MKRTLLALLLCLCVAVLAACQSSEPQRFDAFTGDENGQTQNQGQNQAQNQQPNGGINFDDGSYNPESEEGLGDDGLSLSWEEPATPEPTATPTVAPTVHSQFAGATPVPINPIDMPTATPIPPLTFTYQVYDATSLGLSFQGPVGWVEDASASDTYVIYNPDPSMAYRATLTLRAIPVNMDYTQANLKSEVQSMLNSVRVGFSSFNPSNTATRNLFKGTPDGIYADYTATLDGGVEVAGRVQAVCFDRVLYTVHITCPRGYWQTAYKEGVYNKLRDTISITSK